MEIKRNLNEPCFQIGYQMIDAKIGIGLIGISLNNSYFDEKEKAAKLAIMHDNPFV